jgi:putative holliday junction resolvase
MCASLPLVSSARAIALPSMTESNLPASSRVRIVLGLDFGLRRIGLAAGDTLTRTAGPRPAISCGPTGPDWSALERVIATLRPEVLLVGRPVHMDGTATAMTAAAARFAAELAARTGLPVQQVDERGSSLEAGARLRERRASGLARRRVQHGDIDSVAAVIILERWFAGEAHPT